MPCEYPVSDERREFEVAVRNIRRRRRRPYFDVPCYPDCEVSAVRSKSQRIDFAAKGKVVEDDSAGYVGQDRMAVEIYREEEVSSRIERESDDVFAVREG